MTPIDWLAIDSKPDPTCAHERWVIYQRAYEASKKLSEAKDYNPDQPRDEAGRWSSGEGGTASVREQMRIKASAAIDKMLRGAVDAKEAIDAWAEVAAKATGGVVAKVPLKLKARALKKVEDKYGFDTSRLTDIARNTVVVPTGSENKALEALKSQTPLAEVEVFKAAEHPMGYSGINTLVKTKGGLLAEIQINSPEMIYGKELEKDARNILGNDVYDRIKSRPGMPPGGQGHEMYAQWRELPAKDPRRDVLLEQSKKYYNSVRAAA